MDFLQKIQNKPRHIRVQILWVSVAISMTAIFYLWSISLKNSLPAPIETKESKGVLKDDSQSLEDIKKETISLKESLKASFGAFFEKNGNESLESINKEETKQIEPETEDGQNNLFDEQPSIESQNKDKEIKPAKLPVK